MFKLFLSLNYIFNNLSYIWFWNILKMKKKTFFHVDKIYTEILSYLIFILKIKINLKNHMKITRVWWVW